MSPLVEFRSVERTYPSRQGPLHVIRDVSFTIDTHAALRHHQKDENGWMLNDPLGGWRRQVVLAWCFEPAQ